MNNDDIPNELKEYMKNYPSCVEHQISQVQEDATGISVKVKLVKIISAKWGKSDRPFSEPYGAEKGAERYHEPISHSFF